MLDIGTSFIFFENVKPVHENLLVFISKTVNLPVDIRVEMLSTFTVRSYIQFSYSDHTLFVTTRRFNFI